MAIFTKENQQIKVTKIYKAAMEISEVVPKDH